MLRFSSWLALVCVHALLTEHANANGVLRDGVGGGFALGGADVAFAKDPLMAMHRNPATLGLLDAPTLSFGLTGIHADATFEDASGSRTDLRQDSGAFPDLALAYPIANTRFTLGASLITETARRGDWLYQDALGGVDGATSYGRQSHYSDFMAIRAALGLNVDLTDKLAIGMSVGAVYHRVSLDLPFIFQSHPSLAGWKTLLDLDTDGYGWNADLGLSYRFSEDLHVGLAYRSRTHLRGTGNAHGSIRAQAISLGLDDVDSTFRYSAETETALPQTITGGLSWQFHKRARLALQIEWTDWSDAFDHLGVTLTQGDNAAINELTGSSRVKDDVPIKWDDQLVYRAGLEIQATDQIAVQFGYSYGRNPIPTRWVTPVNASTFEHVISGGLTYQHSDDWHLDIGYQYRLPSRMRVNESAYQAGEYSQTEVGVATHALSISSTWRF